MARGPMQLHRLKAGPDANVHVFLKLKSKLSDTNFCAITVKQAITRGGEAPPTKFSAPLGKCVGHNLKLLDKV